MMPHMVRVIHPGKPGELCKKPGWVAASVKLIPIIFHGSASVCMTHLFSLILLLFGFNAHVPKLPLSCRKKKDTCVWRNAAIWCCTISAKSHVARTIIFSLMSAKETFACLLSLHKGSSGSSLIILSESFSPFSQEKKRFFMAFYPRGESGREARGKLSIFVVKTRLMFPLSSSINCFFRYSR